MCVVHECPVDKAMCRVCTISVYDVIHLVHSTCISHKCQTHMDYHTVILKLPCKYTSMDSNQESVQVICTAINYLAIEGYISLQ